MGNNAWPENCKPFGDHFICNIVTPLVGKSALTVVNPDPRKQRLKPDAYPAVVEEVGSRCSLVKPGDVVVVERWMYEQFDVDDQRIVASEPDLLILNNSKPAPGIIVVDIIDDYRPITNLLVPDTYKAKNPGYIHGRVSASNHRDYQKGIEVWFQKFDRGQYRLGSSRIVFRVDETMMLAVREQEPLLEVV